MLTSVLNRAADLIGDVPDDDDDYTEAPRGEEMQSLVVKSSTDDAEEEAWNRIAAPALASQQRVLYATLPLPEGASRVPSKYLEKDTYLVDAMLHYRVGVALGEAYAESVNPVAWEFVRRASATPVVVSPPENANRTDGLARAHWRILTRANSPFVLRLQRAMQAAGLAPLDHDDPFGDALDICAIPVELVYFLCGHHPEFATEQGTVDTDGVGGWRSAPIWALIAAGAEKKGKK